MKPALQSNWRLLRVSAGLFVWCSAFVALYAGYSLGCQHIDMAEDAGLANPVTLGLVAVALAHLLLLAILLWRHRRRPIAAVEGESDRSRRVHHWLEGFVLWLSLAGTVFIAFPILMVPPCLG
ncbi:MAG: hypothetical protein ACXIUB_04060 [Wenzhouxiangella sp.]